MRGLPRPVATLLTLLSDDPATARGKLAGLTEADWQAAIALADLEKVTPALCEALADGAAPASAPAQTKAYVAEIFRLNVRRNRRIREQLLELLAAFNRAGLAPMLLKGSAPLLEDWEQAARRVIIDIDLLIDPAEEQAAIGAIAGLDYLDYGSISESYAVGYFARPGEPAALDLHRETMNVAHMLPAAAMRERARPVARDGVRGLVPCREDRFMHLVLHEMVHHRAHLDGIIGLRALLDFRRFTVAHEDLDWRFVLDWLGERRALHVLRAQALLGAPVPPALTAGLPARLFYWRLVEHWRRARFQIDRGIVTQLGKILAYPFDPRAALVPFPLWIGRALQKTAGLGSRR
jgi:hypothetical protein